MAFGDVAAVGYSFSGKDRFFEDFSDERPFLFPFWVFIGLYLVFWLWKCIILPFLMVEHGFLLSMRVNIEVGKWRTYPESRHCVSQQLQFYPEKSKGI